MSFDPQSPSDRADMEPDAPTVCEWCDEQIDQSDVDVEAFETFGGMICRECAEVWAPVSPELDALRDAYRFITQPLRMETPKDGPHTATYRLGDYNGLTDKLRKAIRQMEAR